MNQAVMSVCFSPDGRVLASSTTNKTIHFWDRESGKELMSLKGHTQAVNSVSFNPNGAILISASDDSTVRLWDIITTGKELAIIRHTSGVSSAAFSPDGNRMVTSSLDKTIRLWGSPKVDPKTLDHHRMNMIVESPDGKLSASVVYRPENPFIKITIT